MIIDNSKYQDCNVCCSSCGKVYKPSKDSDIKRKLKVPPLFANIFCSRKCKEKYDEFLEENWEPKFGNNI